MRDAARKPWETAVPVAQANRRRASESPADVPHRPRLPSYPADRLLDLYGSLSALLGISLEEALKGAMGTGPPPEKPKCGGKKRPKKNGQKRR